MGARVLVVDDEPAMLRVVAANLRARGYRALSAASGEAALTVTGFRQEARYRHATHPSMRLFASICFR